MGVASTGCAVGFLGRAALSGRLAGGAIVSLHYVGMAGVHLQGRFAYDADLVAASVACSIAFGAVAVALLFGPRRAGTAVGGGAALLLAIVTLHFVGMSAATLELDGAAGGMGGGIGRMSLAAAVGAVAFVVLALGVVAVVVDLAARRTAEARITHQALHDPLTGLPNRRLFDELLERAMHGAERRGTGFALLVVDLDDFKAVNDLHGHTAGDRLIREVARRLSASIRTGEAVVRLGGDEFALVDTGSAQPESAEALAGRLLEALDAPIELDEAGQSARAGASIGIATWPEDGRTAEELVRSADTAMYRVKRVGKAGWRRFEPRMNDELLARRRLEARLRAALEAETLALAYQPLVRAGDGGTTGFEALLRWHDDELGQVSPAEFVPVAETSGLIGPLGEFVLRRACRDAARWSVPVSVAVNLSVAQFGRGGLSRSVADALGDAGLSGERLELEVTESLLIENSDEALRQLAELKGLGASISMDDFGTGYSSLGYLRSFDFDKLKIDRSFVSDIATDARDAGIVRAVVALGASLGMRVLAEGVETRAQATLLAELGCDELQGSLFSKAMPDGEVDAWLARDAAPDRPGSLPRAA